MHQTTVRFGRDLWEVLEQEAQRLGVSAAQYVRDATLARLAYAAASGEEAAAARQAFAWAGEPAAGETSGAQAAPMPRSGRAPRQALVSGRAKAPLKQRVEAQLKSAEAVQAQGKLARGKAERLRAEAEELREHKAKARKK